MPHPTSGKPTGQSSGQGARAVYAYLTGKVLPETTTPLPNGRVTVRARRIDSASVLLLLVCLASAALALVQIFGHGLTPLALIPAVVVGIFAVTRLFKYEAREEDAR